MNTGTLSKNGFKAEGDLTRHFTAAEANASLSYVSRIVEDVITHHRHALRLGEILNSPRLWEIFNLPQIEDAYIEKMKRRNAAYEEIRDMGAYMACFGNGVVLFPAQDDETGETYDYIWRYNQGRVKRHFPDRSSGLIFPFHLGNDPG